MGKTAWVDVLRLIGKTKQFFITMTVVVALAVMGYTGMSFATRSLCQGCEEYYDNANFFDLQLGCIYGFTDEELETVRSDPRVEKAELVYSTQELISIGGDGYAAEFYTNPGEINKAELTEGSLPAESDECVIENALAERFGLKVGDTVTVRSESDELVTASFKIVGKADLVTVFVTDDYYNRGASDLGDGQVTTKIMVTEKAFSQDTLKRTCYLTVKNRPSRGSEEYETYISELSEDLVEKLSLTEKERARTIRTELLVELSKAEVMYDIGIQAIQNAEETIENAEAQLPIKKQELDKKKAELNTAKNNLVEHENYLKQCDEELAALRKKLDEYGNTDEAGEADYQNRAEQLSREWSAYYDDVSELSTAEEKLTTERQQIADTEKIISEKQKTISEEKYRLTDLRNELDSAYGDINQYPDGRVYATDILANPSYLSYSRMTSNSDLITTVLCVLLLAIATLVCFTTISRMVVEQHRLVGTQKALGFRDSEICGKYVIYVVLCTMLGSIIGLICSYTFLQKAVFVIGYGKAFLFRDFHPIIIWWRAAALVLGEIALLSFSAYLACRQILKKSAIDLLNSNIRSKASEVSHVGEKLPLSLSMTLRNLRSNPQILATTLISVFGCTVLLIVVLTVRNSMAGIASRQFDELQSYDGVLTVNSTASSKDLAELDELLFADLSVECLRVKEKYIAYEQEEKLQYATLICLDTDEDYGSFLKIIDGETEKAIEIPQNGVLICQKLSENRKLRKGDSIVIRDGVGTEHTAFIAGVFDRNIGMAMVCSTDYYAELMGEEAVLDMYYVKGDTADIDALLTKARDMTAYCGYSDASYFETEMEFKISSVNSAVMLISAITFCLSLFVLSNLSSMNIQKKEKEIVIMKVHGFSKGRVRSYVFWETMVMCTIGLVLGIVLGGPMGSVIARSIEMENLKDIRGISLAACAIGGGVNVIFFTVSNLLSLRGVDKIKMTGSAREA